MAFKLKSGNKISFKQMGSSPAKHKTAAQRLGIGGEHTHVKEKTDIGSEGKDKKVVKNMARMEKAGKLAKQSMKKVARPAEKKRTITDETKMKPPYKKPVGPRAEVKPTKKEVSGDVKLDPGYEDPIKIQKVQREGLVPGSQKFVKKSPNKFLGAVAGVAGKLLGGGGGGGEKSGGGEAPKSKPAPKASPKEPGRRLSSAAKQSYPSSSKTGPHGPKGTLDVVKKVARKKAAKKIGGKVLGKLIPGVGAGMMAYDVLKHGVKNVKEGKAKIPKGHYEKGGEGYQKRDYSKKVDYSKKK